MAQAPREHQLQLLEVARLDAQLAKIRSQMRNHHLRAEISAVEAKLLELNNDAQRKRSELSKTEDDAAVAQERLASLEEKVRAKDERLNAGVGMDSRELLALQAEIETGRAQISELEDTQFDLLETSELLEKQLAHIDSDINECAKNKADLESELAQDLAELESESTRISEQRLEIFTPLASALQEAYERARTSGGIAVIALHHNGESTGGVALSPIEVAAVKAHDPDDIYISEDYDCVVVLLDA
ncbi:zinc ribbon domain-containing protein [Arcanobacterium bovis]|uniref:CT398-like coiled coil hairpin domain-containing protein n=1 Tax=Arcanobacterium bovis TaxID=2529275 RepID=A0A4Q9V2L1_9ACTO|nr:hypothetical protein [Arcanobacterium bovis]TBW22808.1 hypothetical protein EZJ44_02575 [Arcanobacterium bovis]